MGHAVPVALLFAVLAAGFFTPAINAQATCSGSLLKDLASAANKYDIGYFVSLLSNVDGLGDGPYTFFAPVDAALQGTVQSLGLGDPKNWTAQETYIATNVLFYHIAPGSLASAGISKFGASVNSLANNIKLCTAASTEAGDKNITDNFNSLQLTKTTTSLTITAGANSAEVVTPDIKLACQPSIVLHTIDKVLLPCDFTKYLKEPLPKDPPPPPPKRSPSPSPAIKRSPSPAPCKVGSIYANLGGIPGASLGDQLVGVLQPDFNGTVFVPSDKAALALATALNVTLDGLLTLQKVPAFAELLSYHVVPKVVVGLPPLEPGTDVVKTALAANAEQTFCKKAAAGTLTIAINDTVLVTGATGDANVIDTLATCSGAIHIIDAVLLPCTPATSNIQAVLDATVGVDASPSPDAIDPTTNSSTTAPTLVTGTRGTTTGNISLASGNSTNSTSTTKDLKINSGSALAPSAIASVVVAFLAYML